MVARKKRKKERKYIFVVGGVMSGVGKGVTTSSIGLLMQSRGYTTTAMKIDPYINVDAGNMSPAEHGEAFVLCDGDLTDQDMGNYERFLNTTLSSTNYMTTGRVYRDVIDRERRGAYRGKCVQVVPHIPLEVIRRIESAAEKADADIMVIEIGGTVGEYENILFLETARMLELRNPDDVSFVMVSYIPNPKMVGEMKTKPTQHAVRSLNSAGIQPNVIIARSETSMDAVRKDKIATFCNIQKESVISAPDVESIYDVPVNFEKDRLSEILLDSLKLKTKNGSDMKEWKRVTRREKTAKKEVNIAIIADHFTPKGEVLSDAYISITEALKFSSWKAGARVCVHWFRSEDFEGAKNTQEIQRLSKMDGILMPGGSGDCGVSGKMEVTRYAREKHIPYFGICYGMELAVIEFARSVAGIREAGTTEIDATVKDPVVTKLTLSAEKLHVKNEKESPMRIGSYVTHLEKGSLVSRAYGRKREISERYRHGYQVNHEYREKLEENGLIFSSSTEGGVIATAELPESVHPFFIGTQFHPEFQARPLDPHPLFSAFIKAALKYKEK